MSNDRSLKGLLRSWILLEATRFKREMGENLPRWQEKLIQYEKAGGYFVHFSSLPRMNLFIRNKWNTPIGFYAYFLDKTKIEPFGIDRPYMVVLKPKPGARLLNLQTYTEEDYNSDTQKLIDMGFPERVVRGELPNGLWFSTSMPGRKIWSATRALSGADKLKPKVEDEPLPERGGGPTARWTLLLHRRLGYDGVVDQGQGIIHPAEPSQAVFFDTTKLELVEVIEKNKKVIDVGEVGDLFSRSFVKQPLRGRDFSDQDLKDAKFQFSDLTGASFSRADLEGAEFHSAKLYNASFMEANMEQAGLIAARLENANFAGANLKRANLSSVDASSANMSNAVMNKANLAYSNFRNANFSGANMEDVNFEVTNMEETNLVGTNLYNSTLEDADLSGATYNDKTVFPRGFDPEGRGMVLVAQS